MDYSMFTKEKVVENFYKREEELKNIEWVMFNNYLNQLYSENQDVEAFDNYAKDMLTLQYIAYHTSKMQPGVITKQDKALLRAGFVAKFKRTEKGFQFNDWQGKEISVSKLSCLKPFKKQFPHLTDFSKRAGSCHHDSMIVALMTGNNNCKVVTGNVTSLAEDHKFLHSWVEFINKDGIPRVADITFNFIMNKDDYYRIRKAEPMATLTRQQIVDDIESGLLNSKPIQSLDYKVYLLYHDDILQDFKRNPDFYLSTQPNEQEQNQPQ